jgi:hypothetical protein
MLTLVAHRNRFYTLGQGTTDETQPCCWQDNPCCQQQTYMSHTQAPWRMAHAMCLQCLYQPFCSCPVDSWFYLMDQVLVLSDTAAFTSREDLWIVQPYLTLIRAGQHVWVCNTLLFLQSKRCQRYGELSDRKGSCWNPSTPSKISLLHHPLPRPWPEVRHW